MPSLCQVKIIIHFIRFKEIAIYQGFGLPFYKSIRAISGKINQIRDGRFNLLIKTLKHNAFEGI